MLRLRVLQENNQNATIEIVDGENEIRCDVFVEIGGDGVERPQLVITDNVKHRNSDDPTAYIPLMEDEPKEDLVAAEISLTTTTLTDAELGTVLAALRHYQKALSVGGVSKDIRDIAEDAGDALDVEEIDNLCERLNTGG